MAVLLVQFILSIIIMPSSIDILKAEFWFLTLTVDTAAVNINLISFCEGQHFYIKDLRTLRSILSIVLRIRLRKNPHSTIYDPTMLHLISANSSGLIVGLN